MATGKSRSKSASRSPASAKLDALGISWYCEQIVGGKTVTSLAKTAGVSRWAILNWLAADPDRLKISNKARQISAGAFDDMAEQVIVRAKTSLGLSKARELAHHYRWRAAKISPREFGDRQELVGAGGAPLIPDPYNGMTREQWELDGARRMVAILHRGASLAESSAISSKAST